MQPTPQSIIAAKRDALELTTEQINAFVTGASTATWTDYQLSALLMAIFIRGMSPRETADLTLAMMRSGATPDLSNIKLPKVDKHSTGGVGDKVSIHLAPIVAACGLAVPMISGRGLGHTGGTLDKLESIPGFTTQLSLEQYSQQLATIHLAIIGQTPQLVPADKKLYSLRDVTSTVESLPLICASIMSKKLAEGIDSLVLDVKVGRGAFMKDIESAQKLATMMCETGRAMGKPVRALITAMHEPLGHTIGNSLEIAESIQCLKGNGPADLMLVTNALAQQMLILGNITGTAESAQKLIDNAIQSGAALEKFRQLLTAQNGSSTIIDHPEELPAAPIQHPLYATDKTHTHVTDVHALTLAQATLSLGAGRTRAEDSIDPAVGISHLVKIGQTITPDTPLCLIHARTQESLATVLPQIQSAITTGTSPVTPPPLIHSLLT